MDVPSILLGRLAVRQDMQGRGLGYRLLANAIIRSLSDSSAWAIVAVDPKDPKEGQRDPVEFYMKLGFDWLKKKGKRRLYAKRSDLENWVAEGRNIGLSGVSSRNGNLSTLSCNRMIRDGSRNLS
jgi:GNAT superfamily N-acetyltransferase